MTTGIAWCSETWNPVIGCTRVSAGCTRCYAERMAARLATNPLAPEYEGVAEFTAGHNPRWLSVKTLPERLDQPLRWRKPRRVFVCSMADLFHDAVPDEFIAAVFGVMAACPQHTFQVLTKRPARMVRWFEWVAADDKTAWIGNVADRCAQDAWKESAAAVELDELHVAWPLPNVHIGVSVEDQATADERIPLLLRTPAAVRWISAEPLLGPLDLAQFLSRTVRKPSLWVVCGAESGPGARPMHPDWARAVRDQCAAAGVPLFVKQLTGEGGRAVKDVEQFPDDLRVREYPR